MIDENFFCDVAGFDDSNWKPQDFYCGSGSLEFELISLKESVSKCGGAVDSLLLFSLVNILNISINNLKNIFIICLKPCTQINKVFTPKNKEKDKLMKNNMSSSSLPLFMN